MPDSQPFHGTHVRGLSLIDARANKQTLLTEADIIKVQFVCLFYLSSSVGFSFKFITRTIHIFELYTVLSTLA